MSNETEFSSSPEKSMNTERWRRIETIFQAAAEQPEDQRHAFLNEVCAGDAELRSEVESLLTREDGRETLFASAVSAAAQSLAATGDDFIGTQIGPYRITALIGEGGMAEVFRAEREDEFHKQVAIKLIKRGLVNDFLLSRFRYERQILATLEHSNIARLLDGGTTEDGLPFLVMEFVEGVPITEYCRTKNLSPKRRLVLFRAVCDAVQHAHRNLVIHRDLKPSNILVTAEGEVKLLDFGIAKLLNPELAAGVTVAQTLPAIRLMTPDYAAPEQVRGDAVTTATDVYALGAVLYEVLTGERAHQFKSRSFSEIERVVCETEVDKPSSIAERAGVQPRVRRELKGDLDNIVLKAMRKEPERRYQSAEQLSEDIRRYLEGRPVRARKDTFAYRSGKFIRRHKASVAFAAASLVLLIGFAVTMTVQATRIARERDRANQVTDFLVELFGVSDPGEARGNSVTARELLDKGAERIQLELKGQPEVQAAMMDTMGRVYQKLGLHEKAGPLLEEALRLRRETFGNEHADVATSLVRLAEHRHAKGELEAAEPLYREALEMRQRLLGSEHPDVAAGMHSLGLFMRDKADYEAAEPLLRDALAMRRNLFGDRHADVAATLNEVALLHKEKGELDKAEPLYREALEMRRSILGEDHPEIAISLNNLAVVVESLGRYDEAEALYREALEISRRVLGPEHPYVASYLSNIAGVVKNKGDFDGAEALYREALAIKIKQLGENHAEVGIIENNLGSLLRQKGDFDGAEALFQSSLEKKLRTLGPSHPSIAVSYHNLGGVRQARGDHRGAEPLLRKAVDIFNSSAGPTHWRTGESRSTYGACLIKLGRYPEAEQELTTALTVLQAALGEDHRRTRDTAARLHELYTALGNPDKAAQYK